MVIQFKLQTIISISFFFSAWSDRMWNFAIGLYLVQLTPGSLQLTAIYGLAYTSVAVLFSPVVGDWIDRNRRLKVIRILLFLQNFTVCICALFILLCIYKVSADQNVVIVFQVMIIVLGAIANLAGQGEKIAVQKDWIVVVCKRDPELLAASNALFRRIDLSVNILAPIGVGFVMSIISPVAGIIFIWVWNIVSVVAEYFLLVYVYNRVPELEIKQEPESDAEEAVSDSADADNEELKVLLPKKSKRHSSLNFFYRLKSVITGWRVYARQNVALAGMSLALLYLTVLGFNAITTGYAYSQGLSELYVSICFGLGSLLGILGTVLFPKLRSKFGLPKTGLFGFALQWSFLLFCVGSIWAPGSPSYLFNSLKAPGHSSNTSAVEISATTMSGITKQTTLMPISNTPMSSRSTTQAPSAVSQSLLSICILMVGIIMSRAGLWISDLTITQLQQENVPENERGTVGGVQYAFNEILDLAHFVVTILVPKPAQFGYLILMSVSAVTVAAFVYIIFLIKFLKQNAKKTNGSIQSRL